MKTTSHFLILTLLCVFGIFEKGHSEIIIHQDSLSQSDSIKIKQSLDEITIAAFYTPYSLKNIPAPVNLITTDQLLIGDAITPVEAINRVPGILMHHGTLNTNRLSIRGIGSRSPYSTNKIKAYFGEIPLTSGDGETTLEDLENTAIERIEIIKGPASSLYGAGLGGTMLFYPKTVASDFVKNQSTIASFGTFKNVTSAGLNQNKFRLFTLYSDLKSDGFRENNSTHRQNILFNTQINPDKKITGSLLMKLTKMKAFIPSSLDYKTFRESPHIAAANWQNIEGFEEYLSGQLGASISTKFSNQSKVSLSVFGQFRNADELRPFNKLEETSKVIGSRGNFQKQFIFNNWKFNLVTGFELFRENYEWKTHSNSNADLLSDNTEKRGYENLYFQSEFRKNDRFIISAGLNINRTGYVYNDFFPSDGDQSGKFTYDPVLSPRLGFNYQLSDELSIFGNISHGFSPPTLEETLLPEGTINHEIKPEQGWNFEAGFRSKISNRFSLDMSYYRIYVSDLLVARRTGEDAYVGVNAGKSLHTGLETAFLWVITKPATFPSIEIFGNSTFADFRFTDFIDNGKDYSGNHLPGTARTINNIALLFKPNSNLTANFSNRYVGAMYGDDANYMQSQYYTISNFNLGYKIRIKKLYIEFKTGINNLFDKKYAAMLAINAPSFGGNAPRLYYPGNPRNYFASIIIEFSEF